MGFNQLIPYRTFTTHNRRALVPYPVYEILLNVSSKITTWLNGNGHTVVRFLSVCQAQDQLQEEGSEEDEETSVY